MTPRPSTGRRPLGTPCGRLFVLSLVGLMSGGMQQPRPAAGPSPRQEGALLGVQHALACAESWQGLLHLRSWYHYEEGTRTVGLRDQAGQLWDFESPAIQKAPRSRLVRQRFLDGKDQELTPVTDEEGVLQVTFQDSTTLVVERSFRIPDRTSEAGFQQPFSATLSRTSLTFLGRELFLWPEFQTPFHPPVLLALVDSPNWSLVTVAGSGRQVSLPSLKLLRDHFVFAGKHPVHRRVASEQGDLVAVLAQPEFPEPDPLLDEVEMLLRAAARNLGPLPKAPRLLILHPFQDTRGAWQRTKLGASTTLSHLAYLDLDARPWYSEHPLGVVAHEWTHAWLPHALGVAPAELPTWFTEGVPAWYEAVHPWRAGLLDESGYLDWLTGQWVADRQFEPGRAWTLQDASDQFTAAMGAPAIVYRRGALLAAWIDALLRERRPADGGLDGFLRRLVAVSGQGTPWKPFPDMLREAVGEAGFASIQSALSHAGTFSLEPLLERYDRLLVTVPGPALGFRLDSERAPVVRSVRPEGPAAGVLLPGDVIRRVEDQRVPTTQEFQELVTDMEPGVPVRLLIQRQGERLECELTPTTLPRYEVRPRAVAEPPATAAGALLRELVEGVAGNRP